jgi:predicted ATPase
MLRQFRREPRAVQVLAELETAIASDHGLSFWHAGGTVFTGWAAAVAGDRTALDVLRAGLGAWADTGSVTYQTYYIALLAEALARHGMVNEARRQVDEALGLASRTSEGLFEAELHRLRGEFLLADGNAAARPEARESFGRALATAQRQGALSLELRSTLSLSRFDRNADTRRALAEVYGRFTEGFDTPDLQEARQLLEALA